MQIKIVKTETEKRMGLDGIDSENILSYGRRKKHLRVDVEKNEESIDLRTGIDHGENDEKYLSSEAEFEFD